MRLINLLNGQDHGLDDQGLSGDLDVLGLTCDSREVRKGFLFAALPGELVEGRDFIDQALQAGAVCVLAPTGTIHKGPILHDENPRLLFSKMVARFFGAQPKTIAAVTGTNGKTSVSIFLRQIWEHLNLKAASLGTIGFQGAGFDEPGTLTTPDPVKIHKLLKRASEAGATHMAVEASSHGLDQYRLDGVNIRAAGFTNISREHLDYHGNMDAYLASKLRLLTDIVCDGGGVVLNGDIAQTQKIIQAAEHRNLTVLTYGSKGNFIRILNSKAHDNGQQIYLEIEGRPYTVELPLVGHFQAENAMCALGLALTLGADEGRAVKALNLLKGVPGRMQYVGSVRGANIYVDFAHTPDALGAVLNTLRSYTKNKLHVMFGCGGERDAGKRPEMGCVAFDLADRVIVTDDNPRHEDPDQIRKQIIAEANDVIEIGDRRQAIQNAIEHVSEGDVLVLAGKGHEQGQYVLDDVLPFNDVMVAQAVIRELDT